MIQFQINQKIDFEVAYEYEFAYIQNPSISTFVSGFRILVTDSFGNTLYDTTVNSAAVFIQPGEITNQNLEDSSQKVSDIATFTFKFQITNSIPGDGLFQITFPLNEIDVPTNVQGSDTRIKIYDGAWQSGNIIASTRSIIFQSALGGTTLKPDSSKYIQIEVSKILNPKSLKETSSFQVASMDASYNKIDQASSLMTVKPSIPGDIQIFSVGPQTNPQVGQTTDINFNIQLAQQYEQGGYLIITFPPEVTIKTLQCFPFIGFVTQDSNCALISNSPQTVKLLNAVSSTRLFFLISSIQNPSSTKTSSTFQIQAYDASNYLMSQILSGVSYTSTPAQLKSGTSLRSQTKINTLTGNTQTLTFTLTNPLISGDLIFVKVPYDQMLVDSASFSCQITLGSQVTSPLCNLDATTNTTYFLVTLTSPCSSGCSANSIFQLALSGVRNPLWIVSPLTKSIEIYTMTSDQLYIRDRRITNIFTTPALIEGSLTGISLTRYGKIVNSATEIQVYFTTNNLIPANGLIRIYLPSNSFYNPSSGSILCQDLLNSNQSLTCNTVLNTDTATGINYIQVSSKCTSSCLASIQIGIRVSNLKNRASVRSISNVFAVRTFTIEGYYIDLGNLTSAQGLELYTAPFQNLLITSPLSQIVTGTTQSYVFKITPTYGISQNTGQLILTFPSEIKLVATNSQCSVTVASILLTCSINLQKQEITITNSNSQNLAGQQITLTLNNGVQNPINTKATSKFIVKTTLYDSLSQAYNQVEYNDDILSVTADTPNSLNNIQATRSNTQINQQTDLKISFTSTNPIPANSVIIISIPVDQILFKDSPQFTLEDASTSSALVQTSFNNQYSTSKYAKISIIQWCSTTTAQCPAATELKINIKNVFNPGSTKLASLSIQVVIEQEGQYFSDVMLSNIFTTPLLSNGPFKSLSFSQSSINVGETTSFTVNARINNPIPSGQNGTLTLIFPSGLFYQVKDTPIYCLSASQGLHFEVVTTTLILDTAIASIQISMNCLNQDCQSNSLRDFTIFNLRNRYSSATQEGSIQLQSSDQDDLTYDAQSVSFSATNLRQNLYPSQSGIIINATRSNNTVSQFTDLTVYIQSSVPLKKGSQIQFFLPKEQFTYTSEPNCYNTKTNTDLNCQFFSVLEDQEYFGFQVSEFCDSQTKCEENIALGFKISQLKNRYNTQVSTKAYKLSIFGPDQFVIEFNGNTLLPFNNLLVTQAVVFDNLSITNPKVGELTDLEIQGRLQNQALVGDAIKLCFSTPIIYDSQLPNQTCSLTSTKGIQNGACDLDIDINDQGILCLKFISTNDIAADEIITIQISNAKNLYEATQYQSTISLNAQTSSQALISSGQLAYIKSLLQANNFISVTSARDNNNLSQDAKIDITYQTSIDVLLNSEIKISIPQSQFTYTIGNSINCFQESVSIQCGNIQSDGDYTNVTIQSICQAQKCSGYQAYTFSLTGFQNPSQVQPVQQTIIMSISSSSKNRIIDQIGIEVLAQPPIKLGELVNLKVTQSETLVVGEITNYQINFEFPNTITSSDQLFISFPEKTVSFSNLKCQELNSGSYLTCSQSQAQDGYLTIISISNYCLVSQCLKTVQQSVKITGLKNVIFQRPRNQQIKVMAITASGFVISTGIFEENLLPTFIIKNITTMKVVRESTEPGNDNVDLKLSFTTLNLIPQGSILTYTLPLDQQEFKNPLLLTCLNGQTILTCTVIAQDQKNIKLQLTEWCSGDCQIGQTLTLTIKRTKNPDQISNQNTTYGIQIKTSDNFGLQEVTNGVYISPQLVGLPLDNILIAREQNFVGAIDYLKVILLIPNLIQTSTSLVVQMPESVAISNQNITECQILRGSWINIECYYQNYNKTQLFNQLPINQVTMTGICTSVNPCLRNQNQIIRFRIKNPSTQLSLVQSDFNISLKQGQLDIAFKKVPNALIGMLPNNITALVSKVQLAANEVDCYKTGESCKIQLTIQTANPVPSMQNHTSQLQIRLPSQFKHQSTSACEAKIFNYYGACRFVNSTDIQVRHSFQIPEAAANNFKFNYTITIINIKNPFSTEQTDSFTISTYIQSGAKLYSIDTMKSNLTYRIEQPNKFSQVSVIRNNSTPGKSTQVQLKFKLFNTIPQNGEIVFKIPQSQAIMSSDQQIVAYKGNTFNQNNALTLLVIDDSTFRITNLCISSTTGCAESSEQIITFLQSVFINPEYFKDPQDSIAIQSQYVSSKDGEVYHIDKIDEDIFVTPLLILPEIIISDFSISSYNTSDFVQLKFVASLKSQDQTFSKQYIRLRFDDQSLNSDLYTNLQVQINAQAANIIEINRESNDLINYIIVECSQSTCLSQNSIQIQIDNLKNPYFIFVSTDLMKNHNYKIYVQEVYQLPDKIYSSGYTTMNTTISKVSLAKIQNPRLYQSNTSPGIGSQLQISFELYNSPYIDSNTNISIQLPINYTVTTKDLVCSEMIQNTKLTCTYDKNKNIIIISGYFGSIDEVKSYQSVSIQVLGVNNSVSEGSGNMTIKIYNSEKIYAQSSTDFILKTMRTSTECDGSCSLCTIQKECLSCSQPSDSPLFQNGKCISECKSGYFESNNTCLPCSINCQSCQSFDQCLLCQNSNQLLADGKCITNSKCPNGTKLNYLGQCVQELNCQDNCTQCGVNTNYCYICKDNMISLNGKCVLKCPESYFENSKRQCEKCKSICDQCLDRADMCTKCKDDVFSNNKLDLQKHTCVKECSNGSIDSETNSNQCDACGSKCFECSISKDNCTSCYYDKSNLEDLFKYGNDCTNKCPVGFYNNYDNHQCEEQTFQLLSFPPMYLISSVSLSLITLAVSKFAAAKTDATGDIAISLATQIEFLNRLFLLGNLWSSTKTFSFCVTSLTILGNSFIAIYFATLVIEPISTQLNNAVKADSLIFKGIVVLSQITGINTIRLLTSRFFGMEVFSTKLDEIVYYVKHLETISLISTVLNVFQLFTGVSCIFDFAFAQDSMGLGVNSIILNTGLVAAQTFKYIKSMNLIRSYGKVSQM
ncbi:UNKNOWN [Stylonychia lemnae]|uniref:Transmembrane protein n=1 Tax=Stylonychia lemnae TaxID=5949 RepID=A0A078ADN4_STYLE|nr:UNKNOWN [Stylonychia lemnae]|eukprot:CDW80339.1 UNKNOWN [Stylonychia lemnae]